MRGRQKTGCYPCTLMSPVNGRWIVNCSATGRTGQGRHFLEIVIAFAPFALLIAMSLTGFPGKGPWPWGSESFLFLCALALLPPLLLSINLTSLRRIILILSLALFGFLQMGCPLINGTVEGFFLNLVRGKDTGSFAVKLGAFIITALAFSRYYCGWFCPHGIIQELLHHDRLKVQVPPAVDRKLKIIKYIMLAVSILLVILWHYRLFHHIGPFKALFNLRGTPLLIAFLAFWLVLSVYIERPYCRYFCPGGALLALMGRVSLWAVRVRKNAHCVKCMQCVKNCPVGAIEIKKDRVSIRQSECIVCRECEQICPQGVLRYGPVPFLPFIKEKILKRGYL